MNKKLSYAAILLLACNAVCFAAEDTGSFALGFQGIGNIYANARPTMRWKASDSTSFDMTPTFSYQDNGETLTTSKTDISNYGLTLGIVKHLTDVQGLRIGWLTNLAYTYGYENIAPKSNQSTSYNYNNYVMSVGIGPDFEYFIPAFPRISIGAQAIVQYQYVETTYKDTAGPSSKTATQTDQTHSSNVTLLGEVFTARYYF